MTRRLYLWAGSLAATGGALLALTIHSYLSWDRGPHEVQVLTLGQLLGFAVSGTLLVAAAVVAWTQRRGRGRYRPRSPSRCDPYRPG